MAALPTIGEGCSPYFAMIAPRIGRAEIRCGSAIAALMDVRSALSATCRVREQSANSIPMDFPARWGKFTVCSAQFGLGCPQSGKPKSLISFGKNGAVGED